MDKVKPMLEAGVSLPTAIKEALAPMTIAEFAKKHRLHPKYVSNAINGGARVTERLILGLMKELPGATSADWRIRFWKASEPQPTKAAV